jgi:hypothetical protein
MDGKERGARRHQRVGAEAGHSPAPLPLDSDDDAERQSDEHANSKGFRVVHA